jgi:D-glycero-D-manno-heptose 1,7-bisphosphate phosphatase
MQEDKNGKLIILDRDGVINEDSDDYIKSPSEWMPIAGSLAAIARLNEAGYSVTIATNQSGIARGFFDLDTLDDIHEKMEILLEKEGGHIDDIAYCPHGPDIGCTCRKPAPGMLNRMIERFNAYPRKTTMVGDTKSDYDAAMAAGISFALLKTGKGLRTIEQAALPDDVPVFDDLATYVDQLLGQ